MCLNKTKYGRINLEYALNMPESTEYIIRDKYAFLHCLTQNSQII